ncbi:MAG: PIN domain-containing protein [Chloroflexota bacterium]|nr:PIN domain-containing protein [Chloroflexota bacterium]
MIALDTSVVVRYLVGSPPDQARRATALIEADKEVGLPLVAFLETAHVLRTVYGLARVAILDVLIELLTRENVRLIGLSNSDALAALAGARSMASGPIADALIAAQANSAHALPLYTFDEGMRRHGVAVAAP